MPMPEPDMVVSGAALIDLAKRLDERAFRHETAIDDSQGLGVGAHIVLATRAVALREVADELRNFGLDLQRRAADAVRRQALLPGAGGGRPVQLP